MRRPIVERLLRTVLFEDRKMAFLSGPRQSGKTTLANQLLADAGQGVGVNWDVIPDQKRLLKDPYFFEKENRDPRRPFLVLLDEIHKYARWKNLLKGAYDRFRDDFRFLVTGSGRLDVYKKGGDSLLGRYEPVPLDPLTLGELTGGPGTLAHFMTALLEGPAPAARSHYEALWRLSGFPEPLLKGDEAFYLRWFQERKSRLVREDIRDASRIHEVSLLETLSHMIPERVGAPLSVNALREDLRVAFETARDWIGLLERFYYLFKLTPFTGSLARMLRKEGKVYLYDWVEVADEGARFENLVALHLYKAARLWSASGEGLIGLHYLRDKEKREVDFVLTRKGKPFCLVEAKLSDQTPSPALVHYMDRLGVPTGVQLVHSPGVCRKMAGGSGTLWVVSADRWLGDLP